MALVPKRYGMPPKPALIIFIKNPIPGKTKTRLAASVGNEMALKMYGILSRWARDQAVGLGDGVSRYLYYSDEVDANDDWPNDLFVKRTQSGPELGERMNNAFQEVRADGHENILIIGSDCPGITTSYLTEAFAGLKDAEVVIGPAFDGGYTLLGAKTPIPFLFTEMEWSTESVLENTISRAQAKNLSVKELVSLSDVDYIADWHSYGWPLPI